MSKNSKLLHNLATRPDPIELGTPWPVRLVAAIALLNGVFAILEVVTSRIPGRFETLLPFDYDYLRSLGLFAGFLIIYFATQLLHRKRIAWLIALLASIAILAHSLYVHDVIALLLPAVSLILLISYQDLFFARSEPTSVTQGLRLLALSLAVALAYGVLGFLLVLPRDFEQPFNLGQAIWRTLQQYSLVGNADLVPHTRYAKWFLDSLDLLGVTSVTVAFIGLFQPLAYRFRTLPHDRRRAAQILERYGNSSEDVLKLWPEDKSYYFAAGGDGFVAYKVVRGIAFALGDITAAPRRQGTIMQDFSAYCRRHGWTPCFLYITNKMQLQARRNGLRTFKIGEDAILNLEHFTSTTAGNKHFRQVGNKFRRLGYSAEWLAPPPDPSILRELDAVSKSWLRQPGRIERGFALGYFDARQLSTQSVFLVRGPSGRAEAFVNLLHSYNPTEANFDLMRHRQGAETGVMDWLFMELARELRTRSFKTLNLGLAPFSGLADQPRSGPEEWFLHILYQGQFKLFQFQGLRRYKEKFGPEWQSRYVAYQGGPTALVRMGLAINRLVAPPRHR